MARLFIACLTLLTLPPPPPLFDNTIYFVRSEERLCTEKNKNGAEIAEGRGHRNKTTSQAKKIKGGEFCFICVLISHAFRRPTATTDASILSPLKHADAWKQTHTQVQRNKTKTIPPTKIGKKIWCFLSWSPPPPPPFYHDTKPPAFLPKKTQKSQYQERERERKNEIKLNQKRTAGLLLSFLFKSQDPALEDPHARASVQRTGDSLTMASRLYGENLYLVRKPTETWRKRSGGRRWSERQSGAKTRAAVKKKTKLSVWVSSIKADERRQDKTRQANNGLSYILVLFLSFYHLKNKRTRYIQRMKKKQSSTSRGKSPKLCVIGAKKKGPLINVSA